MVSYGVAMEFVWSLMNVTCIFSSDIYMEVGKLSKEHLTILCSSFVLQVWASCHRSSYQLQLLPVVRCAYHQLFSADQ